MAAGDRHRRAQLVRRVVEEPLLPGEQRRPALRQLLHRQHGLLPPPRMPDHREEHGRHERDLEQLAPGLRAVVDVDEDQLAGDDADGDEGDEGRAQPPDAEAVDEREADPDEVERDGLPGLPAEHREGVRRGEHDPRGLDAPGRREATKPLQGGSRHGGRSRSAPPGPASCAAAGRTRRRRSSRGRSGTPRPRRAAARG